MCCHVDERIILINHALRRAFFDFCCYFDVMCNRTFLEGQMDTDKFVENNRARYSVCLSCETLKYMETRMIDTTIIC